MRHVVACRLFELSILRSTSSLTIRVAASGARHAFAGQQKNKTAHANARFDLVERAICMT
ncbi:hypothetical protein DIE06_10700 [Burkholderia sp. Bp8998]|nr:hypothetical protein DIE06_10700 [Burkholderia sp. Bp8998]